MPFRGILRHSDRMLTDFRETVETGLDPRPQWSPNVRTVAKLTPEDAVPVIEFQFNVVIIEFNMKSAFS